LGAGTRGGVLLLIALWWSACRIGQAHGFYPKNKGVDLLTIVILATMTQGSRWLIKHNFLEVALRKKQID